MKTLSIFLLTLTLGLSSVMAQSDRELRKQEKAEAKKEKALKSEESKKEYLSLIRDRRYLLEANTLYGKYMSVANVSSNTNFIKVDGDDIVIQSAGGFYPGYNGLGGITIHGKVTDYDINEDKNGINVLLSFSSSLPGYGVINLDLNSGGHASARISESWGSRVTFSGQVLSLDDSRVFEGMSLF